MTTYVLDAGALIAFERNSRKTWAELRTAYAKHDLFVVPSGVIGQVWRGTRRQARLGQALKYCSTIPLDEITARSAGVLCGHTNTTDVIDASVAVTAHTYLRFGEVTVVTSDPKDILVLLSALPAGGFTNSDEPVTITVSVP
ncbi:MAG: hypothetical protein OXI96_10210 [Acidimicrobiaceae bacterium]|nr:hypothetical protein [Acidimicrobiaceae bacterium]